MTPAQNVICNGFHAFEENYGALECDALHSEILHKREFGPGLFLTQAEFERSPQYRGVNPRPGRNLLYQTSWLGSGTPPFVRATTDFLLGRDAQLLDAKLVCGVPEKWVPEWVLARVRGNPVNNLGAYIRPEFRDITYFLGIDWHQDIIDWPDRVADFVTVYVYLHEVTAKDAPLWVIPHSHRRGAEMFPHDDAGDGERLTGPAGSVYMWHPFTLHGTSPSAGDNARLSIRMLIQGDSYRLNSGVHGPLVLTKTRRDLADNGAAKIKRNALA